MHNERSDASGMHDERSDVSHSVGLGVGTVGTGVAVVGEGVGAGVTAVVGTLGLAVGADVVDSPPEIWNTNIQESLLN